MKKQIDKNTNVKVFGMYCRPGPDSIFCLGLFRCQKSVFVYFIVMNLFFLKILFCFILFSPNNYKKQQNNTHFLDIERGAERKNLLFFAPFT